jgi:transposase-like protein
MECIKCNCRCVRNGKLKRGKQQYICKGCGKQFTENAEKKYISQGEWELVDRLLLEKNINCWNIKSYENIGNSLTKVCK